MSNMEFFAKLVNRFQPLIIFAKTSMLDVYRVLNVPLLMLVDSPLDFLCDLKIYYEGLLQYLEVFMLFLEVLPETFNNSFEFSIKIL